MEHECQTMIRQTQADSWHKHVDQIDRDDDASAPYKLIKAMDGSAKPPCINHALVTDSGKIVAGPARKADLFAKTYAAVSRGTPNNAKWERKLTAEARGQLAEVRPFPSFSPGNAHTTTTTTKPRNPNHWRHKAKIQKQLMADTYRAQAPDNPDISIAEVHRAIAQLPMGKAASRDQIYNEMILAFGPKARETLRQMFNQSWRTAEIPDQWRRAMIVPIPKAGKDLKKPGSWRPIALLPCIAKLFERIVQNRLRYWIGDRLDQAQAGFRACRTADEQVLRIAQLAHDGFNHARKKPTSLVLVDFSRAYDRVWKTGLLHKALNIGLGPDVVRWLKEYLSDRKGQVSFDGALSACRLFRDGLPQGSVLSPLLFTIFINDLAEAIRQRSKVDVSLYADDLALVYTGDDFDDCEREMQKALDALAEWTERWRMEVACEKTEQLLFCRRRKDTKTALDLRLHVRGATKTVSVPRAQLTSKKTKGTHTGEGLTYDDEDRMIIATPSKLKGRVLAAINGTDVTDTRHARRLIGHSRAQQLEVTTHTPVLQNDHPKFLGVHMDYRGTSAAHINRIKKKARKKTGIYATAFGAQMGIQKATTQAASCDDDAGDHGLRPRRLRSFYACIGSQRTGEVPDGSSAHHFGMRGPHAQRHLTPRSGINADGRAYPPPHGDALRTPSSPTTDERRTTISRRKRGRTSSGLKQKLERRGTQASHRLGSCEPAPRTPPHRTDNTTMGGTDWRHDPPDNRRHRQEGGGQTSRAPG